MNVYYINLERDRERREFVEATFAQYRADDRVLVRVTAVDARGSVQSGPLSPGARGCALSHRRCIQLSLGDRSHAHIVEDDVWFGPKSFLAIDRAIGELPESGWDLLFTYFCVTSIPDMVELYSLARQCNKVGGIQLIDLKGIGFAGSTSYIVNGRSKEKVSKKLPAEPKLPYDLELRNLVHAGHLTAKAIFPFPTGISIHGFSSTIQQQASAVTDDLIACFGNLVRVDADISEVQNMLRKIPPSYMSASDSVFGNIVAGWVSEHFVIK